MFDTLFHPSELIGRHATTVALPEGNGLPELALTVNDPTAWVMQQASARNPDTMPAGTPVDTRTVQQRSQDDAAGRVYDPATDSYSAASAGGSLAETVTHAVMGKTMEAVSALVKSSLQYVALILVGVVLLTIGAYWIVRD